MVRSLSAVVAAALLTACGGGDGPPGQGQRSGQAAIPVDVAEAFTDTVVDGIVANGQIESLQQIELRPDVSGRVVELLFREGARVDSGAALLRIDDAELTAEVARATADRDLARQALERIRQLVADRAAAPADLERAEAGFRVSDATLSLLEIRLSRTTVRAPFSGVIGQRRVSVGDHVSSQTPLLSLQTVSPQRVTFAVPERYATVLRIGQDVSFQVAALPRRTFTAKVDFVDPVVTLPARSIVVKGMTSNADGQLQAGMFVDVRLATSVRSGATIVPEEAIAPSLAASYVWVVLDGKASRRDVTLGVRSPGFVEIVSGLTAGEQVVVGGIERMVEGATVQSRVVSRRLQGGIEG